MLVLRNFSILWFSMVFFWNSTCFKEPRNYLCLSVHITQQALSANQPDRRCPTDKTQHKKLNPRIWICCSGLVLAEICQTVNNTAQHDCRIISLLVCFQCLLDCQNHSAPESRAETGDAQILPSYLSRIFKDETMKKWISKPKTFTFEWLLSWFLFILFKWNVNINREECIYRGLKQQQHMK